jgi:hypothetical protein
MTCRQHRDCECYLSQGDSYGYAMCMIGRAPSCGERVNLIAVLNNLRKTYSHNSLMRMLANLPVIISAASRYGIDRNLLAAVVYWETSAAERLPKNVIQAWSVTVASISPLLGIITYAAGGHPLVDLDVWQYGLTGEASMGIGQVRVGRAIGLEAVPGGVQRPAPDLPLVSNRRHEIAAAMTFSSQTGIEYTAANLRDIQNTVNRQSQGIGLTQEQKIALVIVGYNEGQEAVSAALQIAQTGDFSVLEALLSRPYLRDQVGPIYSFLAGEQVP